MGKRERDRRKIRFTDAKKVAMSQSNEGSRPYLILPEDAELFSIRKAGVYRVDILAYMVKQKHNPAADKGFAHYERLFWVHRNVGAEETTVICNKKTFKEPCAECEKMARMISDGVDKKITDGMRPSARQLFNIKLRSGDDDDGKVKIWDISKFLFGEQLNLKINKQDKSDNYDKFWLPEEGMTLKLTAVEESDDKGRSWTKIKDIEFKPRKDGYDLDEVLEETFDLDACLKKLSYKQVKKISLQAPVDDSDDEEEEEEDDEPRRKKSKKRKHDEDDDDDEEESDDDEEDEEEDDSESDEDDEDSDEDDSDDDEEDEDDSELTADDLGIDVGSRVRHEEHGLCKVVHVSGDGTSVKIRTADGDIVKAIAPDELELAKGKKKKSKVSDEEDEEEDDEPARKKKKGKKSKRKDDDEDEDDVPF